MSEQAGRLTLFPGLGNSVPIVRVDDEDDTLGVLEVYIVRTIDTQRLSDVEGGLLLTVSPQRPDLVLTTNVPHGEGNVLVVDSLDVESCIRCKPGSNQG
jgi:hypothetical protein